MVSLVGSWLTYFLSVFFIFFNAIISNSKGDKQVINIGLVYQNYAPSKAYDKAFNESIRNINTRQAIAYSRNLTSNEYAFSPVVYVLPKGRFFPSEVLDCLCGMMVPNRVSLIVFVTASEDFDETTAASQYFLHMASQTGIPIVAWNADNPGFTFSNTMASFRILQISPPIEHQIRAMFALLKRYNWSRFGVVASKIAGSKMFLKKVHDEIQNREDRSFKLEVVHYEEIDQDLGDHHIEQRLRTLKSSEARIILLYSTTVRARHLFQIADGLGLLSEKYLWIGTQSVKGSMTTASSPFRPGMLTVNFHTVSNAMFPMMIDDVLPTMIGLAPKLFSLAIDKLGLSKSQSLQSSPSCSTSNRNNVIWQLGQQIYDKMKESSQKGFAYHPKDGIPSFLFQFNNDGTLKDSHLTISNLRTKRTVKDAPEASLLPLSHYYWDKVGEFSSGSLRMADIEWPENRPNPPQGTPDKFHIRVVTLVEPPFVIISELDPESGNCPGNQGAVCDWSSSDNSTHLKCCTGYCIDLLNKLASDIGFTYILYKVRDDKWGIKTETGWNGLIQDLVTRKAEMCVTALKLNSERAKDIDFSMPFLDTGISIVVKIKSGVLSPTAFLEPFEYSTWIFVLFVAIQAAALAIFFFEWVSPNSFNMQSSPPQGHKFSICRSYWLVWATLFSASVNTNVPRSSVSRIMSLVWAAFGLTFLAVYTANLAAFMITRNQHYQLSGIEDPLIINPDERIPRFRFGTVEGGNTHETMKRNWRRMHEYVQANKYFRDNISAGIEAVREEDLDAFIYDAVVLDYQVGKDASCELTTVGKWASMTGYGIGFPKNSLLVSKVNHYMLQYQTKGDLERLQNFWLTGACIASSSSSQTTSAPLGIENFLSAFVLLILGIVLGLLCLGCEHLYCRHLRTTLKRIDPNGWCGLFSMAMGKSLSFSEVVGRLRRGESPNSIHGPRNFRSLSNAPDFRTRYAQHVF